MICTEIKVIHSKDGVLFSHNEGKLEADEGQWVHLETIRLGETDQTLGLNITVSLL